MTILVVDDDEVDREAIIRALTESQIANPVVTARDGIEALECLRGAPGRPAIEKPLMVLLDLNMPRMNGVEFLQALRSTQGLENTIVFVLSTSEAEEDMLQAYRLHVSGYIAKANAARDFALLAQLLDVYWRLVEFPP
ncbi:MAG: response regulator [Burkholderiaceae bacterium]